MAIYFPNHKKETYKCKKCGWTGLGDEAIMGDEYAGVGFQLDCPVCPGIEEVGFVEFPFLEDVAKNGTGIDKIMAAQRLEFLDELEKSYLKHPSQLPNIDCWQYTFVVQEKIIDNDKYLSITSQGNEIWKERGSWEFYWRFLEIGDILLEKYGKYVMDIVPDTSWINIYGDSLSAADKVHDYRMKIREKYHLAQKASKGEDYGKALQELVDEERRRNPKNIFERWLNKLERRNQKVEEEQQLENKNR